MEYHAVIWYLHLKDKTGKDKHAELIDVYVSSAPSYSQVKFWVWEFKCGRSLLKMKSGLEAQWMPPRKKFVIKPEIWYTQRGEFRLKKKHGH